MDELIKDFDFSEFDEVVKKEDIKEIYEHEKNRRESEPNKYKEVPDGEHICEIIHAEVGYTKTTNKPVLKMTFNITDEDSEFYNCKFFMNQMLTSSYGIQIAREFLKSMQTGADVNYEGFEEFKSVVNEVFELTKEKMEFGIKYWTNEKGFKNYKIIDIYDLI